MTRSIYQLIEQGVRILSTTLQSIKIIKAWDINIVGSMSSVRPFSVSFLVSSLQRAQTFHTQTKMNDSWKLSANKINSSTYSSTGITGNTDGQHVRYSHENTYDGKKCTSVLCNKLFWLNCKLNK